MRSAAALSLVVTKPPSPSALRFLSGCAEKQPKWPIEPASLPLYIEPIAWAASSITTRPWRLAISMISSIWQMRPVRWTGMIALVLGVIALAIFSGSTFWSASTSAKTGVAPSCTMVAVEATKELGGVMTSSPLPMPETSMASSSASVPELSAIASAVPQYSATRFSSAARSSWVPTNEPFRTTCSKIFFRSSIWSRPWAGRFT